MSKSVWLGRARGLVKLAMIGFCGLCLVLYLWLVAARVINPETAIGMHEMIRPQGRPMVQLMLGAVGGALFFTSLYLSDFKGDIEPGRKGLFDIVSLVLSRAAMILVAVIVLVMFYEVVSRYVFSRPTLWANELSLWLASFVFLLAGQYAMQQRSHIRIHIVYERMPRGMRKVSDTISVLLITGFVFALVWGGFTGAKTRFLRMETFGTAWDPPIPGIVKPALLIGMVLVAIQAVSNLIADWNRETADVHADDIDETEIENLRRTLDEQN